MTTPLRFEHAGKSYEVRATLIARKWVVRVFCDGDVVPGVGYSVSGGRVPAILMQQAQKDVQSGLAAERARIANAAENQMQSLWSLAEASKRRRRERK